MEKPYKFQINVDNFDKWLLDNEKYSQDDREIIIEALIDYRDEIFCITPTKKED